MEKSLLCSALLQGVAIVTNTTSLATSPILQPSMTSPPSLPRHSILTLPLWLITPFLAALTAASFVTLKIDASLPLPMRMSSQ